MDLLILTKKAESALKKPLGQLLSGDTIQEELKEMISKDKPPMVISVGDIVTETVINIGITPDLCIIDYKTLRGDYTPNIKISNVKSVKIKNRKGTINPLAWGVISEAIKSHVKTCLIVDGEEDLLGIPCILESPNESYVIYGQPNEGLVVVKVDENIKKKMNDIVEQMESISNGSKT